MTFVREDNSSLADRLSRERRARLAAERLLEQRTRELQAANERISEFTQAMHQQIDHHRHATASARSQAEVLKGQNTRFMSDLERAHTAAVMAERRLWDSIDTIQDGFAVFDSRGRLITANRAYLHPFRSFPAVRPGTTYHELIDIAVANGIILHADEEREAFVARMLDRWKHDEIEPVEVELGMGKWFRLLDRRARDGDMVSLAIDITPEKRMTSALDAMPYGFVLFDSRDRLVMCNESYKSVFIEDERTQLMGKSFEDLTRWRLGRGDYVDARGREETWLSERLAKHRAQASVFEQELADGRWVRVLETATPDGGRVGLRVDMTEMKAQQGALETARVQAEAANRSKSAFLANMSHEIRTPMNGVVGMAELLCDTALDEDQRLFAETIKSSGEALLVIINDVLDYSKIEAQKLALHPEAFDLERLIHEVAMLLQPHARAKGIDIIIDFDMFLPTRFVADPGRVRQVMTNLVGNAVKFTESGHVVIRVVGLEADTAGHHQINITVEDSGIGIAPEYLQHIFGEFNQVDDGSSRKFEGTGLGLAITRRLIEMMEGSVWVESEVGKGSCFGLQLTFAVSEDTAPANGTPITLRRAIIVDDQFINRTILERQLQTAGIGVAVCRTSAEVLALLKTDPAFDVLITDHEMPEGDGIALAVQVNARWPSLPVVLLSSNPTRAREAAGDVMLSAMLQKPILRSDLFRRLQALSPTPPPAQLSDEDRPMRVLAAEDNRTNQLVFAKMVRDLDIDLKFASNGREAVDLWQSFAPDMIFMDISMPEMDGRQAAQAIRLAEADTKRHVPICALTAHAMDGDSEGILAAGIDHYLTKPLRRNAICEMIETLRPSGVRPLSPNQAQ